MIDTKEMRPSKPLNIESVNGSSKTATSLRSLSLILLVGQTVGAIFILRVSRTIYSDDQTPYLNTTAVFFTEIIKVIGSFLLVLKDSNWSLSNTTKHVWFEVVLNFKETLVVGIPAFLYTIQNNLIFIALSNISGALYQVTYQLKILTTAILSVIILRKHFSWTQWTSLFILTISVSLIQNQNKESASNATVAGNPMIGLMAILCACLTSGFAGVYFEKILKGSKTSIWIRNIQLGLIGSILALCGVFWNDYSKVQDKGFTQGYNSVTWLAILLQSAGGLIVAMVLKYADNVLKCFGNAVAIILSCLFSYFVLNEYTPTLTSLLGIIMIVVATFAYGTNPSLHRIANIFRSTSKQQIFYPPSVSAV